MNDGSNGKSWFKCAWPPLTKMDDAVKAKVEKIIHPAE